MYESALPRESRSSEIGVEINSVCLIVMVGKYGFLYRDKIRIPTPTSKHTDKNTGTDIDLKIPTLTQL